MQQFLSFWTPTQQAFNGNGSTSRVTRTATVPRYGPGLLWFFDVWVRIGSATSDSFNHVGSVNNGLAIGSGGIGATIDGFDLIRPSGNYRWAAYSYEGDGELNYEETAVNLTVGRYYHMIFARAANNRVELWQDAVRVINNTGSNISSTRDPGGTQAPTRLDIGGVWNTLAESLDADLAIFRLWQGVNVTTAIARKLMMNPRMVALDGASLWCYYNFAAAAPGTVVDLSGRGHHATRVSGGLTGIAPGFFGRQSDLIDQFFANQAGSGPVAINLSGSLSTSGELSRQAAKIAAGALTPSGALIREGRKLASGSLNPTATITRQAQMPETGTLSSSGAILREARLVPSGSLSSSGALIRSALKTLSGALTPSSTLGVLRVIAISVSGVLSSSGLLVRTSTSKVLGGVIGPVGAIVRNVSLSLSGGIGPTSGLSVLRVIAINLAGTLTASGTLARSVSLRLSGTLSPSGTLSRQARLNPGGSLLPQAVLGVQKTVVVILAGTLSFVGSVLRRAGLLLSGSLSQNGSLDVTGPGPTPPPEPTELPGPSRGRRLGLRLRKPFLGPRRGGGR